MILVWLLLFAGYITCGVLAIPQATRQRYQSAPKDWQYWLAHLLFYSIPISGCLGGGQPSPSVVLSGIALFATGGALSIWAMASNPYFLPNIEMPVRIVRGGAYSICAQPGYAGMSMMAAGSWLMVGHRLAAIPLAAYVALLCWRARRESELLLSGT